ncbi:MAG: hypothetical protein HY882_03315 [Deltaproteobacteria bacterium]|nr:hypothetical protein [Deltaproteobacteria bacterium]
MPKTKTKVTFTKCIQDSQDYASTEEHMVSRVFFDLEIGGKRYPGLYVDIKQPVGGDFEKTPLEVGTPKGYSGPLSYSAFREAAEAYYRGCVGRQGTGIRIAGGSNIRMRNNTFIITKVVEFETDTDTIGW